MKALSQFHPFYIRKKSASGFLFKNLADFLPLFKIIGRQMSLHSIVELLSQKYSIFLY